MKRAALSSLVHPANRVAPCKQGNLSQFLLDLTVFRALTAFGLPLRRLIAFYLLLGKSVWTLLADVLFKFADGIGWLSAPPRDPLLRSLGRGIISIRRWHYTLGEFSFLSRHCAFHASLPSLLLHLLTKLSLVVMRSWRAIADSH
jgi:hypothetical protein